MTATPDRPDTTGDDPNTAPATTPASPATIELPCPVHQGTIHAPVHGVVINYATIPVTIQWRCGTCHATVTWTVRDLDKVAEVAAHGPELVKVTIQDRAWAHQWNQYLRLDVAPAGSDRGAA